jgi:cytochrome c oxidase assembly protein subunit 15
MFYTAQTTSGHAGHYCLSIATAYLLSREWRATVPRADARARALKRVALVAAGAVYVQLLLGAVVRHCWKKEMPDEAFPPRFSDLLPPFAGPPVSGGLSAAILIHGAFAVVVTVALLFAARHVATERRGERRLTRVALALVGLVVVQIGLGLLTFATRTNPNVTTTHVVVGATILGGATLLVLRSFRAAAAALGLALPIGCRQPPFRRSDTYRARSSQQRRVSRGA